MLSGVMVSGFWGGWRLVEENDGLLVDLLALQQIT